MQEKIRQAVKDACHEIFDQDFDPEITRPEERFGDYSTNIAISLGGQRGRSANENARLIKDAVQSILQDYIKDASVDGPGFINFTLTDEALQKAAAAAADLPRPLKGQEVLVEFGDPNPFKEMHIGHVYSYVSGDAIANLLVTSGAAVRRLSYHGDVGLHVAKCLWAIHKQFGWDSDAAGRALHTPGTGIGHFYAIGAAAYDDDQTAKAEIEAINNQVYAGDDEGLNRMYQLGKHLSFDGFDEILNKLSISIEKRYLESQSAQKGTQVVKQNIGRVFEESQGAVVYRGEKVGLHTRVFLSSRGLPTYEAKDLGLAELKAQDFPRAARSIIITAHEQAEYFKVMLAALAEIDKPAADKTTHLSHGFVSLKSGKMSSREGNIYSAEDLLKEVAKAVREQYPDSAVQGKVSIAAVKYAFLKHRLGSDLIFDIKESIGLEGNSGPYLQYAFARANSIIAKADSGERKADNNPNSLSANSYSLDQNERSLARKISEYPEVVAKAAAELMPHHICAYLYELAQIFNSFYEKSRIIGDEREALRLELVKSYSQVLKSGLNILNIEAPERM